jgi:hypothetical protein
MQGSHVASTVGASALQPGIESRILLLLREQQVMLDADLSTIYGADTKVLVQAVKRNLRGSPPIDVQLSAEAGPL